MFRDQEEFPKRCGMSSTADSTLRRNEHMRKPQRTDGSAWQASLGLWCVALAALTALAINSLVWAQREPVRARITFDARKVQGRISPLLYGEFMEFMYEDNKSGLYSQQPLP